MLTEILRNERTIVQPNSQEFFDSYEDLIAELHQFLDRLVAESGACPEIFSDGGKDEQEIRV